MKKLLLSISLLITISSAQTTQADSSKTLEQQAADVQELIRLENVEKNRSSESENSAIHFSSIVPNRRSIKGLAFINLISRNHTTRGAQMSLGFNYTDTLNGLQGIIGPISIISTNGSGIQFSWGLAKAHNFRGYQFGSVNFATGSFSGFQQSSLFAMADEIVGMQWGLVAISTTHFSGIQFGYGFAMANEIVGIQFGPFIAIAQKITGLQIGAFCYAENLKGVQIGGLLMGTKQERGFIPRIPFMLGVRVGI